MATQRTFYLNDNWDITLNSGGNITTTSGKYADAQNVANATRLFTHDAFLAQDEGIPHLSVDLGVVPALSEVRSWYRKRARAVDNIRNATIEITDIDQETRTMRGIITAETEDGETVTVEI
jgi:hypothetical protein